MTTPTYGLTWTPNATLPETRAKAKLFARVDSSFTTDDALFDALVDAARLEFESATGRFLLDTVCVQRFDTFPPGGMTLARGPLVATSDVASVTYIDGAGASQTVTSTDYDVINDRNPPRVVLAHGQTWPTPREQTFAVTVTFTAGYGAAATDVPEIIKTALKMQVAHYYNHRDIEGRKPLVDAVKRIADRYTIW